jgi:hypothetical protein
MKEETIKKGAIYDLCGFPQRVTGIYISSGFNAGELWVHFEDPDGNYKGSCPFKMMKEKKTNE